MLPSPSASSQASAADERRVIELIAGGDRQAFRTLYVAYHRRLSRFLARFLRNRQLIDEVINDTLYAVWCQARAFRGDSQVSTWIFGIAYRKALKALRQEGHDAPAEPAAVVETRPVPTDPEARQRELRQCLDQALASLPAPQRLVIELAYFVGHSCEEIAAITASPVNTIKTRMFHARLRLRELLRELRAGEDE
jgi:RNA polymerase sigma-70 factor (ECF subfamily)